MHFQRLARTHSSPRAALRRALTTAHPHPTTTTVGPSSESVIPLSNLEAQWEKLSREERVTVHRQLEKLQKKNWKELSIDEKKAAYWVAFGPHGPRTPVNPPRNSMEGFRLFSWFIGGQRSHLYSHSFTSFGWWRRCSTKEWQEAANQRAIDMKINPIAGISSEGYEGKDSFQRPSDRGVAVHMIGARHTFPLNELGRFECPM